MNQIVIPPEQTVTEQVRPGRSDLWKTEDYWAIWLGSFLLIFALLIYLPNPPEDMHARLESANAAMQAEEQRAPFRTVAWHQANDAKERLRARDVGWAKTLGEYLGRPKAWSDSPSEAFVLSEEQAAARRAVAQDRHLQAQQALEQSLQAATAAEQAAAAAGFADEALNQQAREAIGAWRGARDAESKARAAATTQAYNIVGSLVLLGVGIAVLFAIGIRFMGQSVPRFLIGFPFVFALATGAYFLAAQTNIRGAGLEYVLWAIALGLLVSNTIGTPKWVKPAVQVEFYIKTGLVLLGASILFGKIVLIGIPGVFVTWVVTPIVLLVTFWFGQRILRMESKTLNITVSADMSVSGVSAAIATAAACRAKKEELTLAVGMSVAFTAVMLVAMPAFIKAVGMNHVLGGAWMGGTIDATGAVVAAGALLSDTAMYVAATIKMIQNIMIGVIAFGVAAYWATRVERNPGADLTVSAAVREIWLRFPKFVLGFLGASVVFSLIYAGMGTDVGRVMIDQGVVRGWSSALQGWFFCLAFVSIGLATNFRDLAPYFKGGKPVTLYLTGQGMNLILTLVMAYIMFFLVFPWVTESLLAS
jgi:uncharacterized membrane protein YadS